MEDDFSGPATDTPTKKMNYYPHIMRLKIFLCKHVILPYLLVIHKFGLRW